MTDLRHLAVIDDYHGLLDALRARQAECDVSNEWIEARAGLTAGHVDKLLGPAGVKHLGPLSFGLMLQSLGLKLIVVEDVPACKVSRGETRAKPPVMRRLSESTRRKLMSELGKEGAAKLHANVSPRRQRQWASEAGRARWAKVGKRARRQHAIKAAVARWANRQKPSSPA